jgi:tetratricopeptide (TPR) repeat protein
MSFSQLRSKIKRIYLIIIFIILISLIIYASNDVRGTITNLTASTIGFLNLVVINIDKISETLYLILKSLLILLALFLIFLFFLWIYHERGGTVIMPFHNATESPDYDGKAISDSLAAELRRIRFVHSRKFKGIISEPLGLAPIATSPETLAYKIDATENASFKGVSLPISLTIRILKQIMPLSKPKIMITGSISKTGSEIHMVARTEGKGEVITCEANLLKYPKSSPLPVIKKRPRDPLISAEGPDLIRNISFKIAKELSPKCSASTWQGLMFYTDALDSFYHYMNSNQIRYLSRAYDDCIDAIEFEPRYPNMFSLLYNMAYAYLKLEKYEKAEKLFSEAIKLKKHDEDFAIPGMEAPIYRKFLSLKFTPMPKLKHSLVTRDLVLAYNGLSIALRRMQDFDKAIDASNKALELDPESARSHYHLGNCYLQLNEHIEAEKSYKKSIECDKKCGPALQGLGYLHQKTRNFDNSINEFKKALHLNPKLVTARIGLAYCYKLRKEYTKFYTEAKIAEWMIEDDSKYNQACFAAICENIAETLKLLKQCIEKHHITVDIIDKDPEFDFVRNNPEFSSFIERYRLK